MDYHKLTQDIIRVAREDCSQRELSEKLGYSFNKIGKIESAQTSVKWSEFINILSSLKVDVLDHLEKYFYNYKSNDWIGASFGDHLTGEFALESIDDVRIQKINKKLKTKFDSIELADILSVLNTRPSMLVGFLHPILNINEISELKKDFDNYQQSANIIAEDPAIAFINCSLVIKDYLEKDKHCDETLALHADCTVQKVREILELNKTLKIFPFNGTHYEPSTLNFSFSNLINTKVRKFNKYTLQKTTDKFIVNRDSIDSSNVYNAGHASVRAVGLSIEASEKVAKLLANVHMEISQIVKEDEGNEYLNLQLICMTSVPSAMKKKEL